MPRVANPPRTAQFGHQSPFKIPLNDDRHEKAVRLQSRQALHDLQFNQLKAAASPVRKISNLKGAAGDSPKTPRSQAAREKENAEDGGISVVPVSAVTPIKRVPILANFEEWMKMATDNKINATNSWNFALIDYFHDMSLLKEGDGVNFQKASCTLDGCVKIYTNRVDSVASETGKLLSGLADSGNTKNRRGEAGGEDDTEAGQEGDGDEGEDGTKKKAKKRSQRSSEATLVPSFAALQLKKFELEFAVDPLFKKASADFDEGGAKGLLLNHLMIDAHGRIVFDSSDEANDTTDDTRTKRIDTAAGQNTNANDENTAADENSSQDQSRNAPIDLHALGSMFFPDINRLDEQDICPSLKGFDLGDPASSLDIPFLKSSEDGQPNGADVDGDSRRQNAGLGDQTGVLLDDDNAAEFDDDDGALAGFDLPADTGFGEGGEAWARDEAVAPRLRVYNGEPEMGAENASSNGAEVGDFDPDGQTYTVSLNTDIQGRKHEDILSYFDSALRKDWAGPEHWRIRRLKSVTKSSQVAPSRRKEKTLFEIDFFSPLESSVAEMIYTPATSTSAISLPKNQWKSRTRNLLPDDKHFNSRQLLRLFLKPKAFIGSRRIRGTRGGQGYGSSEHEVIPKDEVDETFWARENDIANQDDANDMPKNSYDANFFQDDGIGPMAPLDDDEEFADAQEVFFPDGDADAPAEPQLVNDPENKTDSGQEGAFGTQLVTQSRRLRPEYVQYARAAKKVDVRRLKEEMWRAIGFDERRSSQPDLPDSSTKPGNEKLRFTSIMNSLQEVYPKQAMADISTSYCFICVLHLANEKGLCLENEPGLEELSIQRDPTAEISDES
ncbi:MAG: hypothetical protein Q9167_002551 [Letrouitia subvulpina]